METNNNDKVMADIMNMHDADIINFLDEVDKCIRSQYFYNLMVKSRIISMDYLLSYSSYINKQKLIEKCININIFSKILYFKDVSLFNMITYRIMYGYNFKITKLKLHELFHEVDIIVIENAIIEQEESCILNIMKKWI
jgi:hypothetical protein